MSKKNLILLIILLLVAVGVIFVYFGPKNSTDNGGVGGGGTNFFANFLPFGKSTDTKNTDDSSSGIQNNSDYTPPETVAEMEHMKLEKVSSMPVAGFTIFSKERFIDTPNITKTDTSEELDTKNKTLDTKPIAPPTEFVDAIRYVDSATGNIYQTFADIINERKFSSTVIPAVHEAFFGNNGNAVIMRYLKPDRITIASFAGVLPEEVLGADTVTANDVLGAFLPENITDLSVSSDTSKIFYLLNIKDSSAGIVANADGTKKIQVFDSALTEWLSTWPSKNMVTITTKPSAGIQGYMYAINPDKKDLTKIIGGINGLTTLTSPNGKYVLYSDDNLNISIYNLETRESNQLTIRTLPEKCVWNNESTTIYCGVPKTIDSLPMPDSWYQGEVSFSDNIWKVDVKNNIAGMIFNPTYKVGGEEVDIIRPALGAEGNHLLFMNKKDNFLWKLDIK